VEPVIHHGDCLEVMAGMDPESVDAVVTDPPYGLEFMGKEWDRLWQTDETRERTTGRQSTSPLSGKPRYGTAPLKMQAWHEAWARAAYRVAKPSAYLLAFGGTRTVHRLTTAIEDAGWIIRDMLVWAYASGFPKSKASLKPAWEPIVMARKPGPLRMLAIDECRIAIPDGDQVAGGVYSANGRGEAVNIGPGGYDGTVAIRGRAGQSSADRRYADQPGDFAATPGPRGGDPAGRWPANVILTDPIFDGGWDGVVGGGEQSGGGNPASRLATIGFGGSNGQDATGLTPADTSGTYSRFFLVPKADRADREPVLGGLPLRAFGQSGGAQAAMARGEEYQTTGASTGLNVVKQRANVHPTVKPVDLMRHLVRLVTPTGGIVLDPFLGSGTTGLAAEMEGFEWIGIEKEAEYVAIAEARLNGTQRGLGLPA
jgi:site-specific DNA-methyltransferase (adenine-specific)